MIKSRVPGTDNRTISHIKKDKDSTSHALLLPSVRRSPKSNPPSLKSFFRNATRKLLESSASLPSGRLAHPTRISQIGALSSELPSIPSLPVWSDVSKGSNSKSSSKTRSSFSFSSTFTASSAQVGSIEFSLQEIMKSTGNFAAANVIGEVAFGTVYKGKRMDGSVVAIKRAHKNIYGQPASAEFRNEVLTLSKIEHGYIEHGGDLI